MTSIHTVAQFSVATPIDGPAIFSAGEDKYHPLVQIAAVLSVTLLSWAILVALGQAFGLVVPVVIYFAGIAWLAYELATAPTLASSSFQAL